MFTEFVFIALAVCLLLCACTEEDLADGMSFETFLRSAIVSIWVKHYIKGYSLKSRTLLSKSKVRDKVRDSVLTSVYGWSTLGLRPVS